MLLPESVLLALPVGNPVPGGPGGLLLPVPGSLPPPFLACVTGFSYCVLRLT